MRRLFTALALAAATLAVSAPGAVAQDPPPLPPADSTSLIFEREVFSYPTFARRNPFRPLQAGDQGGPRWGQLRVASVIYRESDPSASIATLTTGGMSVGPQGTMSFTDGESFIVRPGQVLGNITVVSIHPDRGEFNVAEFGIVERRSLPISIRPPGGTP